MPHAVAPRPDWGLRPAETFTNLVDLIHRQFATDVCSVYLLEPDRANLVLAATIGLRPESVGLVRMRLTEGPVGLVAEQAQPVVVHDTTTHPRFKYFRDAGEEPYRTFLVLTAYIPAAGGTSSDLGS